jgi:hypothetical protein
MSDEQRIIIAAAGQPVNRSPGGLESGQVDSTTEDPCMNVEAQRVLPGSEVGQLTFCTAADNARNQM